MNNKSIFQKSQPYHSFITEESREQLRGLFQYYELTPLSAAAGEFITYEYDKGHYYDDTLPYPEELTILLVIALSKIRTLKQSKAKLGPKQIQFIIQEMEFIWEKLSTCSDSYKPLKKIDKNDTLKFFSNAILNNQDAYYRSTCLRAAVNILLLLLQQLNEIKSVQQIAKVSIKNVKKTYLNYNYRWENATELTTCINKLISDSSQIDDIYVDITIIFTKEKQLNHFMKVCREKVYVSCYTIIDCLSQEYVSSCSFVRSVIKKTAYSKLFKDKVIEYLDEKESQFSPGTININVEGDNNGEINGIKQVNNQ